MKLSILVLEKEMLGLVFKKEIECFREVVRLKRVYRM